MLTEVYSNQAERLQTEINRRRTFAIISHPDAGKTTLTEKLLLYSGAVEEAGSVRARKSQRSVTSDWMAMERERGISITSTALQFSHQGCVFNLLDTPGHQDFSEDTYRTLMAVDSAVMVLDSAKGIEPQTRKLFEVCRQRRLPILTFINKLDQDGREPLELLDEIERTLHIRVSPMNWPVGHGVRFQGVYDLRQKSVLLFERTARGKFRAPVHVSDLGDPLLVGMIGQPAHEQLCEDVDLLDGAGSPFQKEHFLAGDLTPVFFGSALNNFGVEPFLQALIELAPPPLPRESDMGQIAPNSETFSGFVFKIQANMDPLHRDTMAFLRICSGTFAKDMLVHHPRLNRTIRMSRPHRLFARDRETVDEAFPGDVIGLSNPGVFTIGDTVCVGSSFQFARMPPFQPERFAVLRNANVDKYKQFNKGVEQLRDEGVVQVWYAVDEMRREPILAVIGELQFDVVQARLTAEYGVKTIVDHLSYKIACWVTGDEADMRAARWPTESLRVRDGRKQFVLLCDSVWQLKYSIKEHPHLRFSDVAGKPIEQIIDR